jgi:hypothetical protein
MKLLLSTLLAAICTAAIGWAELPVPREEVRHGEFQYSLEFDNRGVDGRPARPATAYLWIPPSAEKLRGVIVTQQNVGEQPFVEHPAVREVGAKNDLAIVWCCPPIDLRFQHEREKAVRLFEEVLRDLGAHSGYGEIGTVPWITFGHSSTTTFARNLAEARPERTIAILSAKGGIMLPVTGSIPGVYSGGQFPEWRQPAHDWTRHGRSLPGLVTIREELRTHWRPVSYVEDYGGGHFDYTERYLAFLALYIDKAVQFRVGADGRVRPIRDDEGWVVDLRPSLPTAPLHCWPLASAPAGVRDAPWFFDRALAEAAVALMDDGKWDRAQQIVAFANLDGTPATFARSGIVHPVPCEYAGNGVTITRIETTFLAQLPGNFTQAGMKFSQAGGGPPHDRADLRHFRGAGRALSNRAELRSSGGAELHRGAASGRRAAPAVGAARAICAACPYRPGPADHFPGHRRSGRWHADGAPPGHVERRTEGALLRPRRAGQSRGRRVGVSAAAAARAATGAGDHRCVADRRRRR